MSSAEDTDLSSDDARSVLDDEVVEEVQVSDAALETALQTAIATMPSLREALEPVRQPSADALQGELRKALGHYQLKLDLAVKVLKEIAIENQIMKTTLQRRRKGAGGSTANTPVQLEAHRDTIKAAAQKYLYWFHPFPTAAIFSRIKGPRCPQVDIFDPRRARDEALNLQAEVAEVFKCFPPKHPVLQYLNAKTAPTLGKTFISEVNQERSYFVGRVLDKLPSIAPTDWPVIPTYRERALVKANPAVEVLRGTVDDNFPPFTFPPGASIDDAQLAYTGDIFPLIIRLGLFGPSSLASTMDSRAKGQGFNFGDFTPGMFALSATVLRYALSGEEGFSRTSKNIPNAAYFKRLKLHVFTALWDTPAMVVRRARAANVVLGTGGAQAGGSPAETHEALSKTQRNAALAAGFAGTVPSSAPPVSAPAPAPAPAVPTPVTTAQGPPASPPVDQQPLTYIDAPSSRSSRSAIASSSASRRRAPSPISAGLALPDALHPAEELQEHVASLTIHDVPVEEGDDELEQPPKAPAKRAKGRQTTKAAGSAPEGTEKPKARPRTRARK